MCFLPSPGGSIRGVGGRFPRCELGPFLSFSTLVPGYFPDLLDATDGLLELPRGGLGPIGRRGRRSRDVHPALLISLCDAFSLDRTGNRDRRRDFRVLDGIVELGEIQMGQRGDPREGMLPTRRPFQRVYS